MLILTYAKCTGENTEKNIPSKYWIPHNVIRGQFSCYFSRRSFPCYALVTTWQTSGHRSPVLRLLLRLAFFILLSAWKADRSDTKLSGPCHVLDSFLYNFWEEKKRDEKNINVKQEPCARTGRVKWLEKHGWREDLPATCLRSFQKYCLLLYLRHG